MALSLWVADRSAVKKLGSLLPGWALLVPILRPWHLLSPLLATISPILTWLDLYCLSVSAQMVTSSEGHLIPSLSLTCHYHVMLFHFLYVTTEIICICTLSVSPTRTSAPGGQEPCLSDFPVYFSTVSGTQ